MPEHASNGNGTGRVRRWPEPIVVSSPDSAFETVMIPMDDELREALTVRPRPPRPPRRDSMVDENGYLKAPRLPRPENLRWWERLAYAWRGL
ncbi:MAG TPA: hypothetical protein VF006_09230 [Longimicrobium sp.]